MDPPARRGRTKSKVQFEDNKRDRDRNDDPTRKEEEKVPKGKHHGPSQRPGIHQPIDPAPSGLDLIRPGFSMLNAERN